MNYIKLIVIKVDDFCSSVFFEDNYPLSDIELATQHKEEFENKGYVCILANVNSSLMTH